MAEKQSQSLTFGIVFLLFGILFAFLIYLRPDLLQVPAWIAYASAGVFAASGLLVFTVNLNRLDLQKLLILLLALLLCLISGWIAFGPGLRECSVHGVGGWTQQSGLACRIPFGLGMLIPVTLAWAVIRYEAPSKGA
ncbi:hypothetical protein [Acaryochloris sp. IP29b_bin.137]|uniref:hypothetical protein n=1 Tax=Acaryochloris sp. IP29b_bin.137 TaxID=2969217 RepID=UPI0026397B30|nr:hypothetical protein [Acaryochloris sp. IP29b_bin.137]